MDLTRATWRKSSYSGNNGGNCVEVAAARTIAIRDSKDPHGPVLAFAPKDWQQFADRIKASA
jgi:hypothetical protein